MQLPEAVKNSLSQSNAFNGFVLSAVAKVESLISGRNPYFFPEYTDHSIDHSESVLFTAIEIATPKSLGVMKTVDFAVLTLSALLHDLGMHISKGGFESLIAPNSVWLGAPGFSDKPWSQLWQEFFQEAVRFNGKDLERIFGKKYRLPRALPSGGAPWDEFDILLVGDFLRRHHPRLAHDIALYGFPGLEGKPEQVLAATDSVSSQLHDLIGLTARSHGISLRLCMDYMDAQYGNHVDPKQTVAIYLMALIRIGDFFQIQSNRARQDVFNLIKFRSPFSAQEWRVHQSVMDINNSGSDPEAVSVFAEPENIHSYLRLTEWRDGLQRELDTTWAVLGEVYGRMPLESLGSLALRIRRIRTNLDSIEGSDKRFSFLPQRMRFSAASAELLSLLVSPLYGGDISVGVRELLQNAVDSVKEFEDLITNGQETESSERNIDGNGVILEVLVDKSDAPTAIVIEDAGCGMSPDILRKYFLRAGASFRTSEEWQKGHQDKDGNSRVTRSGRFGVGALAAFLLGDEIEVITRHFRSRADEGLRFATRIDSDAINVEKIEFKIGTRISIALSAEASAALKRNHYLRHKINAYKDELGHFYQKYPSVERKYGPLTLAVPEENVLPEDGSGGEFPWTKIICGDYVVFWMYSELSNNLFCNGIFVSTIYDQNVSLDATMFKVPTMSVVDHRGALPLNLQRNQLESGRLAFEPTLSESLADAFIAHCLLTYKAANDITRSIPYYRGVQSGQYGTPLWTATRDGLMINAKSVNQAYGLKGVILGFGQCELGLGDVYFIKNLPNNVCMLEYPHSIFYGRGNDQKGTVGSYIGQNEWRAHPWLRGFQAVECYTWISRRGHDFISDLSPGRSLSAALARMGALERDPAVMATSNVSKLRAPPILDDILKRQSAEKEWMLVFLDVRERGPDETDDFAFPAYRMLEVAGRLTIPYSDAERLALIDHVKAHIPQSVAHVEATLSKEKAKPDSS